MTHDELLAKLWILPTDITELQHGAKAVHALRAVVELHKPIFDNSCSDLDCCGGPYPDLCEICSEHYPCETIQAIEKAIE